MGIDKLSVHQMLEPFPIGESKEGCVGVVPNKQFSQILANSQPKTLSFS